MKMTLADFKEDINKNAQFVYSSEHQEHINSPLFPLDFELTFDKVSVSHHFPRRVLFYTDTSCLQITHIKHIEKECLENKDIYKFICLDHNALTAKEIYITIICKNMTLPC